MKINSDFSLHAQPFMYHCHNTTPLLLWHLSADAASDAAAVTYIGGLHSPPVSQPTAIHQDIQLGGEEGDRPVERPRWVVSGRALAGDPHGTGGAPALQLLGRVRRKNKV